MDWSSMQMAPGYVAVKMDSDDCTDLVTNMAVVRHDDQAALFRSRIGTVVAAPAVNCFLGEEVWPYMNVRDFGPNDQKHTSRLTARTCYLNSPIEVEAGSRVLVKHIALVQDHLRFGDVLIVKYDTLVARIDGDSVYPLNGLLFLEMREDTDGWFVENGNEFGINFNEGRVVAQGAPVSGYLMFPGFSDPLINLSGANVLLAKNSAARIEHDDHQKVGTKGKPLYAVSRYFVNGFIAEDVIM